MGYQYDRYGNRAVTAGRNHGSHEALTPTALTSFNVSTNRLLGGAAYDGAGNLTLDWGGRRFKYDGDNRMVNFTVPGTLTNVNYRYDGEGRRVRKEEVGGGSTTYVYNVGGQLVAEYASSGTALPGIRYLTPDHLGNTRVVTQAVVSGPDGGVVSRHDYLAFGEEIVGLGGRSSSLKYPADPMSGPAQKFTGKERDGESGLGYFKARYYAAVAGRFSSPDPGAWMFLNPQSYNGYSYALNNPLRFTDPLGEDAWDRIDAVLGWANTLVLYGGNNLNSKPPHLDCSALCLRAYKADTDFEEILPRKVAHQAKYFKETQSSETDTECKTLVSE